ncbi:hypothetical protein [Mesorhizobium sp.]|uniref:hypothetical protein n=1 Tax=Mesorhizobium sp. TaxID=1871066 RepID=UPI000FE8E210|nr:hypothetical protein [Mesorhizobium sp.]RWP95768.1 MAG: hypothetical protein EOR89_25690 [Mesorhizobium sp.]RWQ27628.1 MAG: hypothetical protein EOS19_19880 [Mesorhizobium sp.]
MTSTLHHTVESFAEAYVAARGKSQFVSTTLVIRAVRTLLPACAATDREIADIIAAASIRRHLPVALDGITSTNKIGPANDPSLARVPESDLQ